MTFVGNHDVTRIASQLDDARHVEHALVLLLTTGGTPSIYAGDEWAYRGVKEERFGGDDAVRPEFAARPSATPKHLGHDVFRLHQHLIGLRRRHPWLHAARTDAAAPDQPAVRLPHHGRRRRAGRGAQRRRRAAAGVVVGVGHRQRTASSPGPAAPAEATVDAGRRRPRTAGPSSPSNQGESRISTVKGSGSPS